MPAVRKKGKKAGGFFPLLVRSCLFEGEESPLRCCRCPWLPLKKHVFSAHFGAGGAAPPLRVLSFSKVKCSKNKNIIACYKKYPSLPFRCSARVLGKMGEFEGETTGTPFLASLRKGWALFAASSDPTGGRRPCPLGDAGALRASTAEQRGFFPLKKTVMSPEPRKKSRRREDRPRGQEPAPAGAR